MFGLAELCSRMQFAFIAVVAAGSLLRTPELPAFGGLGRFGRGSPPPAPPPAPPPMAPAEQALLRVCAGAWVAATPFALTNARPFVQDVFGLATSTFEDNLREPAAGLLEITSPLFPLEAALLFALAGAVSVTEADRARIGAALASVSAVTLGNLVVAFASGLSVTPAGVPALAAGAALTAASGVAGVRASQSVDEPLELFKAKRIPQRRHSSDVQRASYQVEGPLHNETSKFAMHTLGRIGSAPSPHPRSRPCAPQTDAVELLPFVEVAGRESGGGALSTFYRSSTLLGLVVGASFLVSPISPIGFFETEAAATHLFRQELGTYICFLLCPVQAGAIPRCTSNKHLQGPSTLPFRNLCLQFRSRRGVLYSYQTPASL